MPSTARLSRAIGADQRGALTILIGLVFAVAIYAAREAMPNPNEGITNLYAVPIAIVAVRFGATGGAVAALLSLCLFAGWELNQDDVNVGLIGYANRGIAFLVLGLIVGRFASERRHLVTRLAELATTDPLTGLANRARFEQEFAAELARVRRHGRPGAILLADLDGFKAINDALGHAAGDAVLRAVADILRDGSRGVDLIARMGGDEFVLLLPDTSAAEAEDVARRLSLAIASGVREIGESPVELGASIGCAPYDGSTVASANELLDAADASMYLVKAGAERHGLTKFRVHPDCARAHTWG